MVRTSRCFASDFSQLGGPEALVSVECFRCDLPFANFPFAHFQLFSTAKFVVASFNLEATRNWGSALHDQKGDGAAHLLAAC
jgi:hypothetical protein